MSDIATQEVAVTVKDATSNPGPMGLLAFGMSTLLLNVHGVGFVPLDSLILVVEIFSSGVLQVIAGILDWKKGNAFGCFTFVSAGFFWIEMASQLILPRMGGWSVGPSPATLGLFLLQWAAISVTLFIAATKLRNRAFQIVIGAVLILFLLASAAAFTENAVIGTVTGYVGIAVGVLSMFVALRQLLKEVDQQAIAVHRP